MASPALQQAGAIYSVENQIHELKNTLTAITTVLSDAEEQRAKNPACNCGLSASRRVLRCGGCARSNRKRMNLILMRGSVDSGATHMRSREMTYSFISESDVVGRDIDKQKIIKMLMRSDDKNLSEIWARLPLLNFDLKRTIEGIVKEVTRESLSHFDIQQLQTILRDTINDKKYLLVLDDVWSNDRTYSLKGLSHKDSMAFFEKWAFGKKEKQARPDLLEIGNEIVEKSQGVPLLVKTNEKWYWAHIRDSETWKLMETDILPVFKLSYDHLPSHLKCCFAIISLFPKGYEIASNNLIRLWMALGLISSTREKMALEDIGVEYVKDLWKRSLLHVVEESESRSIFTVHDLVHSVATNVAQSDCSIVGLDNAKISKRVRSLVEGISNFDKVPPFLRKPTSQKLHAIRRNRFQFGVHDEVITRKLVRRCISNCNRLRYLDLSCGSFEELPRSICNLNQLRSLRNFQIPFISKHNNKAEDSTRKWNTIPKKLHFLGIHMCANLQVLFEGASQLTCLRELEIGNCERPIYIHFENLIALESLAIDHCELTLTHENKPNFPLSLRKLVISWSHQVMELLQCLNQSACTLECFSVYDCASLTAIPEWLPNHKYLRSIRLIKCRNLSTMLQGI
ncbi:hypothetical protein EUGRSUZ_L03126 [Eucalyptus grandis]|uniref:Disease resistance protein winged helix domain-containing protein n=1 Tax=Eucalyptus grandis TaxID=71139 RepID=A0AAD9T9A0_EUCGR|nr:hypothetical protein EUGRSUZ_L03126 [Eucalyptus grandis]